MIKGNDNTFVKITNHDVYCKLLDLETKISEFATTNAKEHSAITKRQDYTNGKVKLSKWIATTAITLVVVVLGFLFNHISMK